MLSRISLLLLLCVFVTHCPVHGQSRFYLYNDLIALPVRINTLNMLHVEFDTTLVGSAVEQGQIIGRADSGPLVRSARYGMKLIAAEDEYAASRYAQSAALLQEAAQREHTNPFIGYQLARSLYRNDATKPQAFQLYQRLVRQLDAAVPVPDSVLNTDVWFAEAYWKLGTLYLDRAQWADAARSIAQFQIAAPLSEYQGTPLHEEIMGYLTECFYQLHDAKLCRHFGNLTLKYFPQNQYVRPYLAHLPKTKPKPLVQPRQVVVPHR
ncbi:MAG: hypothetical protein M3Y54_16010 [Bacteroidota bacterium]|nr:hypothetical protein [Bacteroidota bacterium]